MESRVALLQEAEHRGLKEACEILQTEAKAEIGHYQQEAGPFQAWPELAESTKQDRVKSGFPENEPLLRTGETRDSIEYTVGHGEARVGSNSPVAVAQEIGTDKIPARSFLGGAAVRKHDEIVRAMAKPMIETMIGMSVAKALGRF